MNYPAAMFWMNFTLAIINLVGVVYVWWSNREKVTTAKFDELKRHINQVEGTVKQIEIEVKHRPDCQHHQGFEDRLDAMNGKLNRIEGMVEGRLEGIGNSLDLIQQHLLNGGK